VETYSRCSAYWRVNLRVSLISGSHLAEYPRRLIEILKKKHWSRVFYGRRCLLDLCWISADRRVSEESFLMVTGVVLETLVLCCTNPENRCLDEPAAGLTLLKPKALTKMIRGLYRAEHNTNGAIKEHDWSSDPAFMDISDILLYWTMAKLSAKGGPDSTFLKTTRKVIAAYSCVAESQIDEREGGHMDIFLMEFKRGCMSTRANQAVKQSSLNDKMKGEIVTLIGSEWCKRGYSRRLLACLFLAKPRIVFCENYLSWCRIFHKKICPIMSRRMACSINLKADVSFPSMS